MSAARPVSPRHLIRPVHRSFPCCIGLQPRSYYSSRLFGISSSLRGTSPKTVNRLFIGDSIRTKRPIIPATIIPSSQAMATVAVPPSQEAIAQLQQYTACDISDALLKLKVPKAGFIADLNPYHGNANTNANAEQAAVTVAPVSTVLFTPKDEDTSTGIERPAPNFPKDTHWVDNAVPGTFAVLRQPEGQTNAVCGGIMALRMKVFGVKGIIVSGRIRDLAELQNTGLPIWARGTSTVGSGGSSTPWAMQVPLDIDGVVVSPGDLAMNDLINGVVIIPQDKVDKVLELLPQLTSADDKAKEDVANGVSVKEAFRRHRGA